MKYCTKCGAELVDDAVICIKCGCAVSKDKEQKQVSWLKQVSKILMILGTVFFGLWLIPLAWCIPMTISYSNKIKSGEPVSTGFKVCCLLFVSFLAGIFMLCDHD